MVFLEVTVLYTTHHLPLALIVFLPLLEHFQSLGRVSWISHLHLGTPQSFILCDLTECESL